MKQGSSCCKNMPRGCAKLAIIIVVAIAVLAGLICFIVNLPVDELKHNFSVWTIVALVVIINLVSFLCFIAMFAAWHWARRDFKTARPHDDIEPE